MSFPMPWNSSSPSAPSRPRSDRLSASGLGLTHAQAEAYGTRAEIKYPSGYPVLINHPAQTRHAHDVAARHFGEDRIDPTVKPITASEDFAYMLEQRPGTYLFIGNGDSADLHSPRYDFDDAIIPDAAAFWVHLAEDFLSPQTRPTQDGA